MNNQEEIIAEFVGKKVPTHASYLRYSKQDALKRSLGSLGLCWIVGLVCVAVPVLHFVLTPMALICGPFVAVFVYIKTQKLPKFVKGSVECLHCKTSTAFDFVEAKPPLYTVCEACRNGYEVLWPPGVATRD